MSRGKLPAASALLAAPSTLAAASGGDAVVIVADSRRYTGLALWWTNLYNESHFWFAAVTIIVIPALAVLMAAGTGFLMRRLGINLKSRVLAEG